VSRKFTTGGARGKSSRDVKYVDSRLKKDKRGKALAQGSKGVAKSKSKGIGKGKGRATKPKGVSAKRQIRRHRGKKQKS